MKTVVVFRKWRDSGDILALMPEIASDIYGRYCQSYEHVGQHGGADYTGCIAATVPATKAEYRALAKELRRIGYKLDIRQRATSAMQAKRLASAGR